MRALRAGGTCQTRWGARWGGQWTCGRLSIHLGGMGLPRRIGVGLSWSVADSHYCGATTESVKLSSAS